MTLSIGDILFSSLKTILTVSQFYFNQFCCLEDPVPPPGLFVSARQPVHPLFGLGREHPGPSPGREHPGPSPGPEVLAVAPLPGLDVSLNDLLNDWKLQFLGELQLARFVDCCRRFGIVEKIKTPVRATIINRNYVSKPRLKKQVLLSFGVRPPPGLPLRPPARGRFCTSPQAFEMKDEFLGICFLKGIQWDYLNGVF